MKLLGIAERSSDSEFVDVRFQDSAHFSSNVMNKCDFNVISFISFTPRLMQFIRCLN